MKALKKLQKKLHKVFGEDVACRLCNKSIELIGELENWQDVVKAGKLAAKCKGYKGVVNHIKLRGYEEKTMRKPTVKDMKYEGKQVDVAIIGGGIIGCAIARELSKWHLEVMVIEKEYDVALGASSRNDGMVHPGIDLSPGSKKAYYNSRGNEMYGQVAKELGVPFERRGSYILFDKNWHKLAVPFLKSRARKNNIPNVKYVRREHILEKEKYVADWVKGGLYMGSSGVVSPYKMTIAYAEHAALNGCTIALSTVVEHIQRDEEKILALETNRGTIYPQLVINAAGVYADKIAEMVDDAFFTIHPRKGTIAIMDTKKGHLVQTVVAKAPFSDIKKHTKGGGVVRTIDGNLLVGPDAHETPEREDTTTDKSSIEAIFSKHKEVVPSLEMEDMITYFAGVRAPTYKEDFIVEPSEQIANLIYAAGIQSPGITAAPAIAKDIEKMVIQKIKGVKKRKEYIPTLTPIPDIAQLDAEERNRYIKDNPAYGIILCRCEGISKGEIQDALKRPLKVASIDAIKRRVRAGMGRCQGGFCSPVITQLIAEEEHIALTDVCKGAEQTELLVSQNKKLKGFGEVANEKL